MSESGYLKSAAARFTFYIAVSVIIAKGIGILSTKLFTNLLTTNEYGLYNVFVNTNTFILGFSTLGLTTGLFRFLIKYDVAKEYQKYKNVLFNGLIILFPFQTFLIIIIFIFGFFGITLFNYSDYILLILGTSFVLYSLMFNNLLITVVRGKLYAKTYLLVTISQPIFLIIIGVIFIKVFGDPSLGLIYSYIISQYILTFAYIIRFGPIFKGGHFAKEEIVNLLTYSLPGILPHLLSVSFAYYLSTWALQAYFGNSSVALYKIGITISNLIGLFTIPITSGLSSIVYRYYEHNEHQVLSNFLNRTLRVFLLMFVSLIFIAYGFSRQFILLISNENYLASRIIILPLLADLMIQVVLAYTTQGIGLKNKMNVNAIGSSCAVITGFISGLLLIPIYGILGSALSQVISDFFLLLILIPLSQHYYNNHFDIYRFSLLSVLIIGGFISLYSLESILHSGFLASIMVAFIFITLCLVTQAVTRADLLYSFRLLQQYIPFDLIKSAFHNQ